jgi:hypothetical protein
MLANCVARMPRRRSVGRAPRAPPPRIAPGRAAEALPPARWGPHAAPRRRACAARRPGRPATIAGSRWRRTGTPPSARRPADRPSSPDARRAAGSRWARPGNCRACSRHIFVQPVEQRVGALEPAGALHVRVHHDRHDVRRAQFAGPAAHLGVAEAVKGEARLPAFDARRAGCSGRWLRPAQRARAQLAVLQHLGVAQGHVWPAAPCTVIASQPTRFWPKSSSVLPDGDCVMATGWRRSVRRTGGPTGATSVDKSQACGRTPRQPASSKPGADQPGCSSRASYVSPS